MQQSSHLSEGIELLESGHLQSALGIFRNYFETQRNAYRERKSAEIMKSLSASYEEAGDTLIEYDYFKEADEFYHNACICFEKYYIEKRETEDLLYISRLYEKLGDYSSKDRVANAALSYYQKAHSGYEMYIEQSGNKKISSNLIRVNDKTGKALLGDFENRSDEAGIYFRKVIEADKNYYEKENTDEAIEERVQVYNSIGDYWSRLRKDREARKYYKKARKAEKKKR